jgi:hypothetical protein
MGGVPDLHECRIALVLLKAVSTSRAGVDVILKHPMIAFIAMRCADASLLSCVGACILPYFGGRCQIDAA